MTVSLVIRMVAGVATAGENAAPLQSSGGKATKTSKRSFAEVATQVRARENQRAYKIVAGKASKHPPVGTDPQPVPVPAMPAHTVVTKPPKSGIRKTDSRAPTGEIPDPEMLAQVGGEATVSPTPTQAVKGPLPKAAVAPTIPDGKEQTPNKPASRGHPTGEIPIGKSTKADVSSRVRVFQRVVEGPGPTVIPAEGQGHGSSATIRADTRAGLPQQAPLPAIPEKPVLSKRPSASGVQLASSVPKGSDKQPAQCDAPPPATVTSSHKDETATAPSIPAKQVATEARPVHGRIPGPQIVEPKVLQAGTPVEDTGSRAVQARQANPTGIEVHDERPLIEFPHPSAPNSGNVPLEVRQAAPAVVNPRQTRQAGEMNVSPVGAKVANASQANGNAAGEAPAMLMEGGGTVMTQEPLSVDASVPVDTFQGAAGRGPAASVGEQILDSVQASLTRGEQQLVVRLRPPELGSVLVRFGQDNEGIHGVLEVGRSETRREIEQVLPQMLRSLQELGIQVRRLDVTVTEQPGNDLARGQSQQGAWTPQQGTDQHANQPQRSFDTGWAARPDHAQATDLEEVGQSPLDALPGRVDMLA